MKKLKILGVYRLPLFSNNAIEADRSILEESIKQLIGMSPYAVEAEFMEEPEVINAKDKYDLVLTMAQSEDTLKQMEKIFLRSVVWNSPRAIRNCYRLAMSNALIKLPVHYVPFHVFSTEKQPDTSLLEKNASFWLKRSDFHAIADEDVCLVESLSEIPERLERFRARNVKEVLVQKHIHGDIYKFYGVKGNFFRPIKVRTFLENPPKPNFEELEKRIQLAAEALSLHIYGGDCVFDERGNFHLIDLNDWPSFRICRKEAATAIATLAIDHLTKATPIEKSDHANLGNF